MSYKLKTVLDELDGAGMIAVDDDLTIETLNEYFGINIHHDRVLTSEELEILHNTILELQSLTPILYQDGVDQLVDSALEILEV